MQQRQSIPYRMHARWSAACGWRVVAWRKRGRPTRQAVGRQEESTMRRSTIGIILALALGCLVAPHAAEAQQPVKVHRIGVLMFTSSSFFIEELRQGLRELGYVEGQNLTLEVRSAEGRRERLADLAAELVRLPVDLIVAHTTAGVLAAKHATTTLPIVAAVMTDPVEAGIVESLARPGGNITGSFLSRLELQVKRLELLKEALPGVTRVAVFLAEGTETRNGSKRWSAPPGNWGWNCTRWRCADPTTSSAP